ncbi:MAG TPA: hypothetical protein VKR05_05905, partial [Candidatus Cybelea sp.]|nr:hypothetical protein [Candidatus Cybelea sp.]
MSFNEGKQPENVAKEPGSGFQFRQEFNLIEPDPMDLVPMTRERLENQLLKNERRTNTQLGWQISGPLVIAIVLALVASDFHSLWGFSKEAWFGLFVAAAIIFG